ncbi:hypothetical protein KSP39_PZI014557 [Platanthera zijinensis]|uniref:Uncharacterized protein n=1 Tax=Platanthera zijinensis TaxID=2320716 RepID=A0AAP0BA45_9ASPA
MASLNLVRAEVEFAATRVRFDLSTLQHICALQRHSRRNLLPLPTPSRPRNLSTQRADSAAHPADLLSASPTSSVDTVVSASSSTTSASINLGKSFEGSDAGSLSPPLSLSSSVGAYKYSGTLSRSCIYDQTKSDVNGDSGSRLARPSGLRIPRPTFGYFDKTGRPTTVWRRLWEGVPRSSDKSRHSQTSNNDKKKRAHYERHGPRIMPRTDRD